MYYYIWLLEKFQFEQIKRHEDATQEFKKLQERTSTKIEVNRKQQEELKKKLSELVEKEEKLEEEKTFQQQVQTRAELVKIRYINIFFPSIS